MSILKSWRFLMLYLYLDESGDLGFNFDNVDEVAI
jgi:hypothetical protein